MNYRLIFILLLALSINVTFAQTEKRLALVIGNSEYTSGKLNNAVNDANKVSAKLKELGFNVMLHNNTTFKAMTQAVNNFTDAASNYDVALFFYAGHGIQCDGSNYLIPVNDDYIKTESDIKYYTEDLNRLLDRLENSKCKLKIIILDACRNNPLARSWHRSASSKGLAFINAPNGTLIAYATSPGCVADDGGTSQNSPYTTAFLQTLDKKNVDILNFFNEVGKLVNQYTKGKQTPWISNSPIDGYFIFNARVSGVITEKTNLISGTDEAEVVVNTIDVNKNNNKKNNSGKSVPIIRSNNNVTKAKAFLDSANSYYNKKSYKEAVKYYIKAAELGSDEAQNKLGECYYNGQGVTKSYSDAVVWYRKSAEQGNATAQCNLGVCYGYGQGVPQSDSDAVVWFRKSAEQGYAYAQLILGACYEYGQGVPKSYSDAVVWYRKSAEQGNAAAQYNLGYCYDYGQGVPQSYSDAVVWYRKSAEQGYARAQCNLGVCYELGQGVTKSYSDAVVWYRKSAEQGYDRAQCYLGECYELGQGVTKSYSDAVVWYRKSAEQGYANAQCNLGVCYELGQGVPQSYSDAVVWYRKSAEQGYARAQCILGYCYEVGNGVPQSYSDAVVWYRKSAEQGYARAQCNLGVCFYNGQGVPQSYSDAVVWLRKSAEQGYARAQCNLGLCYEYGKGVTKSLSEAKKWYAKSAGQGNEKAIEILNTRFKSDSTSISKITGRVVDKLSGEPLIGASVSVVGTKIGAVTDVNGYFEIAKVPTSATKLSIAYIGYKTKNITNLSSDMLISLSPDK